MGKISYVEKPEVLVETLKLFLDDLNKHEQFDGTFRKGRIDGFFFSNHFFDARRTHSFLEVKGTYNLDKGILAFRLNRSKHYYILSFFWIIFAIVGSFQSQHVPFKLFVLFPISLGFFGIALYHFVYQSRVSEFLKTFNHYLNLSREKFNADPSSKTQNTDSKPPHSTP